MTRIRRSEKELDARDWERLMALPWDEVSRDVLHEIWKAGSTGVPARLFRTTDDTVMNRKRSIPGDLSKMNHFLNRHKVPYRLLPTDYLTRNPDWSRRRVRMYIIETPPPK